MRRSSVPEGTVLRSSEGLSAVSAGLARLLGDEGLDEFDGPVLLTAKET
jgi:hypothetical protein